MAGRANAVGVFGDTISHRQATLLADQWGWAKYGGNLILLHGGVLPSPEPYQTDLARVFSGRVVTVSLPAGTSPADMTTDEVHYRIRLAAWEQGIHPMWLTLIRPDGTRSA